MTHILTGVLIACIILTPFLVIAARNARRMSRQGRKIAQKPRSVWVDVKLDEWEETMGGN